MNEREREIWRNEVFRQARETLANYPVGADLVDPRPTLPSISALGPIIIWNKQQNALIQQAAAKSQLPNPNAEPPRVLNSTLLAE
jgi:hypothetical protein